MCSAVCFRYGRFSSVLLENGNKCKTCYKKERQWIFTATINMWPQLIHSDLSCHIWAQALGLFMALANTFDLWESSNPRESLRKAVSLFMLMQTSGKDGKVNWFNFFDKSVVWKNGETAYWVYNPICPEIVRLPICDVSKIVGLARHFVFRHVSVYRCQSSVCFWGFSSMKLEQEWLEISLWL